MFHFLKDKYFKNLLTLITGAGVSQFLPVVFSPVLGRIYSPHEFGVLAIFMALCSIFGMISTGMYELSIMLPEKDKTAYNLLIWVVFLSFGLSVILFVLLKLACFIPFVAQWEKLLSYDYLLPFGIFSIGIFQGYTYWLNRIKNYKKLNTLRIGQSIIIVIVSILFGYFGFKKSGLIFGFLVGGIFTTTLLLIDLFKLKYDYDKNEIYESIRLYNNYPRLILPSSLVNTTASYAPVFFISRFFDNFIAGSYSMSARVLTAPVSIISVIMGQMYYKKITDLIHLKTSSIFPEFKKNTIMLLLISMTIFIPLFFFGKEIVLIVFGNQWDKAGDYIEILALATLVKFVVSPLSSIFLATNKLKNIVSWQSLYFCTTVMMFSLGIYFALNINHILWIYVVHETILYTIYYLLMVNIAKKIKGNG